MKHKKETIVKSRGVARILLNRNMKFLKMSATMLGRRRKFLGFGPAQTVKFGTLSMISHGQSCLP